MPLLFAPFHLDKTQIRWMDSTYYTQLSEQLANSHCQLLQPLLNYNLFTNIKNNSKANSYFNFHCQDALPTSLPTPLFFTPNFAANFFILYSKLHCQPALPTFQCQLLYSLLQPSLPTRTAIFQCQLHYHFFINSVRYFVASFTANTHCQHSLSTSLPTLLPTKTAKPFLNSD